MAVYAVSAAVRAKGISNLKLYHFNWQITFAIGETSLDIPELGVGIRVIELPV